MNPANLQLGFYILVLLPWTALSAFLWQRRKAWAFTPRWHRVGVPLFRVFLIGTLPFEHLIEDRPFIPSAFFIGAVATLVWLGIRARYVLATRQPLPAADSVPYNLGYIANLLAFAVAMHSWVCLAVMINISVPALLLRVRWLRRCREPGRATPAAGGLNPGQK